MTALLLAGDDGTAIKHTAQSAFAEMRSAGAGTLAGAGALVQGEVSGQLRSQGGADLGPAAAFALMRCSHVSMEARLANVSQLLDWQIEDQVRQRIWSRSSWPEVLSPTC
jgi:hypothetical protein